MHLFIGTFVIGYNLDKIVLWISCLGVLFWIHYGSVKSSQHAANSSSHYFSPHGSNGIPFARDLIEVTAGVVAAIAFRYLFGRQIGTERKKDDSNTDTTAPSQRPYLLRSIFDGTNPRARSELMITVLVLVAGMYGYHDEVTAHASETSKRYPIGAIRCLLFCSIIYYLFYVLEYQWLEWGWLNDPRTRIAATSEETSKSLEPDWLAAERGVSLWILGQAAIVCGAIVIDIFIHQPATANMFLILLLAVYAAMALLFKAVFASVIITDRPKGTISSNLLLLRSGTKDKRAI